MAAQQARELAEVYEGTERQAAVERGLDHARQSLEPRGALAHGGLAAWHLTAALGHTAGAAGTSILGLANAGVSLASAAGYGPDREVGLDNTRPPQRQRDAETFISSVAQAASPPEPAMASTASAEERQAARENPEEIGEAQTSRVQAERARIEMAESRRPQIADTNLPFYATRAARDVAGPAARLILAR